MYKQYLCDDGEKVAEAILRKDGWCIPFDVENSDYQNFKKDMADGAELKDANGNVMTSLQIQIFMATLP